MLLLLLLLTLFGFAAAAAVNFGNVGSESIRYVRRRIPAGFGLMLFVRYTVHRRDTLMLINTRARAHTHICREQKLMRTRWKMFRPHDEMQMSEIPYG